MLVNIVLLWDGASMWLSSISSKGQIVIPKEIRKKYGLDRGGKVAIFEYPEEIVIVPLPEDTVKASKGMFKSKRSIRGMLEEARKEERHAEKRKPRGLRKIKQ